MTRGGGGSSASSSRAAGKAPAVPQKRVSKASSGKKRKRLKTTTGSVEPESLTYYESTSASEREPLPPSHPVAEPKRIKLHSQWY